MLYIRGGPINGRTPEAFGVGSHAEPRFFGKMFHVEHYIESEVKTMTFNDLVTLGKMGFSRDDIFKLMQAETAQPVPVAQPAPAVVPAAPVAQPAPAVTTTQPDFAAQFAELNAKIDSMSYPQAGQVGVQPQAMSIDDIIAAPFKIPAPTQQV